MSLAGRRLLALGLAGAIFALDQWIKGLMLGPLALRDIRQIEIVPFFNLTWAENYGVSLGMLTANSVEARYLLVALTSAVALAVFIWILREKEKAELVALALVLGGALGNIFDRFTRGFVVDYADLHFGEFRPFLIFNFADAAITIGVLIILARSLLSREKPKPAAEAVPES